MPTTIVNIRQEQCDVYIGRPSKWGNPFVIGRDGNREEVLLKYNDYILSHPELISLARTELKGKKLGCYCKPLDCHGDILAEIAEGVFP